MTFREIFNSLRDVGFAIFGAFFIIFIFIFPWIVGLITILHWLP